MQLVDLKNLMEQGFARMDKRFENIDLRFEKIDSRFENIDSKFNQIDKRFENLEGKFDARFDALDYKIDRITEETHARIDSCDIRIDLLSLEVNELNGRMYFVENKLTDMYELLDASSKRMDTYWQEFIMLSGQVNRHNRWIYALADRVNIKLKS